MVGVWVRLSLLLMESRVMEKSFGDWEVVLLLRVLRRWKVVGVRVSA